MGPLPFVALPCRSAASLDEPYNLNSLLNKAMVDISQGDARYAEPVTLPHSAPSVSFWSAKARHSDLIGHRSAAGVQNEADCVIIGSGMAGSLIAFFLLSSNPELRNGVVCLEAREAISAATACNGGHCRPDCYRAYTALKRLYGGAQAMKVLQNEMDTLNLVEQVVTDENIDCDFWRGRSFDVMMTEECEADFRHAYEDLKSDGGDLTSVHWIQNETEARQATRVKDVKAAASFPAGSFYPYKFTAHLLKKAIAMGLNLQTNTPALRVLSSDEGHWIIETPRGKIRTKQVVHATNAYAAAIFPELARKIVPVRGQCSSITPTKPFSGRNMMSHTICLYRGSGDADYLIQRHVDGTMILGGGECIDQHEQVGNTDDSTVVPAITEHLSTVLKHTLEGWGEEAFGEGLERTWTGIQGYTADTLPFVGEYPEKKGQFVIAGFHGHGMARIATCARGVAMLLRGRLWEETGLPECFQVTEERLSHNVEL